MSGNSGKGAQPASATARSVRERPTCDANAVGPGRCCLGARRPLRRRVPCVSRTLGAQLSAARGLTGAWPPLQIQKFGPKPKGRALIKPWTFAVRHKSVRLYFSFNGQAVLLNVLCFAFLKLPGC